MPVVLGIMVLFSPHSIVRKAPLKPARSAACGQLINAHWPKGAGRRESKFTRKPNLDNLGSPRRLWGRLCLTRCNTSSFGHAQLMPAKHSGPCERCRKRARHIVGTIIPVLHGRQRTGTERTACALTGNATRPMHAPPEALGRQHNVATSRHQEQPRPFRSTTRPPLVALAHSSQHCCHM